LFRSFGSCPNPSCDHQSIRHPSVVEPIPFQLLPQVPMRRPPAWVYRLAPLLLSWAHYPPSPDRLEVALMA
ncbi:hypothetical protein PFISCL1PPCAC_8834, partial [Pristionchus fissidentatus]